MIIAPPIITPRDKTVGFTIPSAAKRSAIQTMMPMIHRPAPTMFFIWDLAWSALAKGEPDARDRRRAEVRRGCGSLWITPTPRGTTPIFVGMFEPPTVPVVNMANRNAMPVPIAPLVLPMDSVPAPPASGYQLDGRCHDKLDRARIRRERDCLCRCCQG
jgi:hypothetical protein